MHWEYVRLRQRTRHPKWFLQELCLPHKNLGIKLVNRRCNLWGIALTWFGRVPKIFSLDRRYGTERVDWPSSSQGYTNNANNLHATCQCHSMTFDAWLQTSRRIEPRDGVITYSWNPHNPYRSVDSLSYGLSGVMGSKRSAKKRAQKIAKKAEKNLFITLLLSILLLVFYTTWVEILCPVEKVG